MQKGLRLTSARVDDESVAADIGDAAAIADLVRTCAPASLIVELDLPDRMAIEIMIRIKTHNLAIQPPDSASDVKADAMNRASPTRVNSDVLKQEHSAELLQAIRAMLVRREYPGIDRVARFDTGKTAQNKYVATVAPTPRQQEIIRMIASGVTSQDIAATLNISVLTVRTHRQNLMKKLRLSNTADIIAYAIRYGLYASF